MTKQEIRQRVRLLFARSTEGERREWSEDVCKSLLADPRLLAARYIFAFMPMKDEVDILPALDVFLSEGKQILMPRVVSPTDMTLYTYPQEEDFANTDAIDAVIVPGMAFTRGGKRLGRGKGYYDRFLPLIPRAYLRGVCFPYQIVDDIPCETHDILMHYV